MEKVRFQLPAAEDDLWYQVVVRLLEQRDSDEEQARNHLRLLEELAFHHWFCGKPLTRVFVENAATWLAKERDFGSPRDKAQEWLHDLVERWELLLRRGSGHNATYEFAIPMLDEYFAAQHLAARWAEEDETYRAWLPCRQGWWWSGLDFCCPSPYCRVNLKPFHRMIHQPELEDLVLLMVGLLKDREREKVLFQGICHDVKLTTFKLKALSRCHHYHGNLTQEVLESYRSQSWSIYTDSEGIQAMGRAREKFYCEMIVKYFVTALCEDPRSHGSAARALIDIGETGVRQLLNLTQHESEWVRWRVAKNLICIREPTVVPLLIEMLRKDRSVIVREAAALELGLIRDDSAVDSLIDAFSDNWIVRHAAATALKEVKNLRAIPLLRNLLNDQDEFVRIEAMETIQYIERGGDRGSVSE